MDPWLRHKGAYVRGGPPMPLPFKWNPSPGEDSKEPESCDESDGPSGGGNSPAKSNSAISHLVFELVKVNEYLSEKVQEKEVSFEVERRSFITKVDELDDGIVEKFEVAVREAEERIKASKNREWGAKCNAEIKERKVFGSKFPKFSIVRILRIIPEELLDVDPNGKDTHDLRVTSILKVFASILGADDKISVEGHPFLDGMLDQVYSHNISMEDFEMAFVTQSFLETVKRSKGKRKAKISEVREEEESGMENVLKDNLPTELFDCSLVFRVCGSFSSWYAHFFVSLKSPP
ncbi:hypothetical protein P7C70_g5918, partial [Phenoliferia sp. Uapishka_3]